MISVTLADLAEKLGGEAVGDGKLLLRGVAELESAGPGELSFLASPRFKEQALASAAGALVAPRGAGYLPMARLECDNPYLVFARAVALFHPEPEVEATRIHPSAQLEEGVELEDPVEIGPLAILEAGVRVGAGSRIGAGVFLGRESRVGRACRLHPRVVLYPGTCLGDRVAVHAGAILGSDGFGNAWDGQRFVKFPQIGRLVVEDDVEIGANTAIDRAALGETRICRGARLDILIPVAHNCRSGEHSARAAQGGLSGSTRIGARCKVGGQAGFAGHLTVGDDVNILAKSGIHCDLPSGTAWFGFAAEEARRARRNLQAATRLHEMLVRLRELEKRVGGGS